MGYSIMTPFDNVIKKEKMERFLNLHFKPLDEITSKKTYKGFNFLGVAPYDDLAYGTKKNIPVLGYNYNSFGISTDYYMFICFWMAIMDGKTKKTNSNICIPYVLYDGNVIFTLHVNTQVSKNVHNSIEVDEFGYRESLALKRIKKLPVLLKLFKKTEIEELKKIDITIHEELKRLTREWKEFN